MYEKVPNLLNNLSNKGKNARDEKNFLKSLINYFLRMMMTVTEFSIRSNIRYYSFEKGK